MFGRKPDLQVSHFYPLTGLQTRLAAKHHMSKALSDYQATLACKQAGFKQQLT